MKEKSDILTEYIEALYAHVPAKDDEGFRRCVENSFGFASYVAGTRWKEFKQTITDSIYYWRRNKEA